MALGPLDVLQGQTYRTKFAIALDVPTTPPLQVTVDGNTVSFAGSGGPELSLVVMVTAANGAVHTFVEALGNDWPLSQIATVVAAAIAYNGGGDSTQAFSASAATATSFTIGPGNVVSAVSASVTQNNAFDLTGATATLWIRKTYAGPPLFQLSTPDPITQAPGGLTLDPVAGTIEVYLSPTQTAALSVPYAQPVASSTAALFNTSSTAVVAAAQPDPYAYYLFDIRVVSADGDVGYVPRMVLTVYGTLTRT
jgi:hypothetical protein